jgi:hypothetical protein
MIVEGFLYNKTPQMTFIWGVLFANKLEDYSFVIINSLRLLA